MTRNQRQSGSEGASHDYTSTSMVQCAGRESEDHGRIKDVQQDRKRQLTKQELRDLIWEKARQGMKTWQKKSNGSTTVDVKTSEKNSLSTTWVQCAGWENGRKRQTKELLVEEKWPTRKIIESNAIWKKKGRSRHENLEIDSISMVGVHSRRFRTW